MEFALVLPLIILAIASLAITALVIRDQLVLWHGAYAGAHVASLEPDNYEAIQRAVKSESGLDGVEITTSRNDPYITVSLTSARKIPLIVFNWSLRTLTLHASVTMHIQDT